MYKKYFKNWNPWLFYICAFLSIFGLWSFIPFALTVASTFMNILGLLALPVVLYVICISYMYFRDNSVSKISKFFETYIDDEDDVLK